MFPVQQWQFGGGLHIGEWQADIEEGNKSSRAKRIEGSIDIYC